MIINKRHMRLIPDFYSEPSNHNSGTKEAELREMPNSYLELLEIQDVLETSKDDDIITLVCSKIKSGGQLNISGIDGHAFAMNIAHGAKSLQEINREGYIKMINRLHSLSMLREHFMSIQWKIISASVTSEAYNLQVEKP